MFSGMKPVLKWLRLLQREESTLVVRLFATKYVQNLQQSCLWRNSFSVRSRSSLGNTQSSEQSSVVSWVPETLVLLSYLVLLKFKVFGQRYASRAQAHTESAFSTQEKSSSTHVICHSNIFLVLSNFITGQVIFGEMYNDWDVQSLSPIQGGLSLCIGL